MSNQVNLSGRLARDWNVFGEGTDKMRALNAIAVNQGTREDGTERPAMFFNIVAWGGVAKFVAGNSGKGQLVSITGNLREYRTEAQVYNPETKTLEQKVIQTVEVRVSNLMPGPKAKKSGAPAKAAAPTANPLLAALAAQLGPEAAQAAIAQLLASQQAQTAPSAEAAAIAALQAQQAAGGSKSSPPF